MPTFINFEDTDLARFGLSAGAIAGNLVFAAAMALDLDKLERSAEAETIADETRICIRELERILAEAGCTLDDLVKVNCYLSEDEYRAEFWATYDAIFEPVKSSAVRLTQVAGLAGGCRVELDAVAVRPESAGE
jgi:2-iminobutanoate/2-iminopropanoate deaminase